MHQCSLKAFLLLGIMLFVSSCTFNKTISLVDSGKPAHKYLVGKTIPFALKTHFIIIPVHINNSKEAFNFLLDTGSFTVIDQKLSERLKLAIEANLDLAGTANHTEKANLVILRDLTVGSVKVVNCAAAVVNLSSTLGVDGILGSNFLRHFQVTIDYKHHCLTFGNNRNKIFARSYDIVIPFTSEMRFGFAPIAKCTVEGDIQFPCIFDTGALGVTLPIGLIKKTKEYSSGRFLESEGAI